MAKPPKEDAAAPFIRPNQAVPSRKKKNRNASAVAASAKESKAKRKWMEKKQAEELKRNRRVAVLDKLALHSISADQRALLKRTSEIGLPNLPPREERVRDEAAEEEPQASPLAKRLRKSQKVSRLTFVPLRSGVSSSSSSSGESGRESDEDEVVIAPIVSPAPAAAVTISPATVTISPAAVTISPAITTTTPASPPLVVRPDRPPHLAAARLELPVCGMEQEIMEAISSHPVVVLCGETGSGKTTQVPQFLLEAGYGCTARPHAHSGLVAVCEPRRVAAMSMARRVASELGVGLSRADAGKGDRAGVDAASLRGCVGYQVRHDGRTVGVACRIKFMTDGVLLREAKDDVLLRQYSCVVLDEAHERGINSDLLLGLLSRVVPLRAEMHARGEDGVLPLKVVIMSATLAIDDFCRNPALKWDPPVIRVSSRQFPVTPHFAKRTAEDDWLPATLRKVAVIHRKLPPGGVLVFLPGQRDIEWLAGELRRRFGMQHTLASPPPPPPGLGLELAEGSEAEAGSGASEDDEQELPPASPPPAAAAQDALDNDPSASFSASDSEGEPELDDGPSPAAGPVHVVELFSKQSLKKQWACFQPPPPGHRLVVVATNVAETSLTIPNIRYVVDCGREKRRVYNQLSGTATYGVGWTSQASAAQRMGRAGRTGPGHCYRLYSSAVYESEMAARSAPEVLRMPIEDLVLYMKTLGVSSARDFPFATRPSGSATDAAILRLKQLGALDEAEKATALGALMGLLPLPARLAKMVCVAAKIDSASFKRLLPHVLLLCAHAAMGSPLLPGAPAGVRDVWRGQSDQLAWLRAAGAFAHAKARGGEAQLCRDLWLSDKAMAEAAALAEQLRRLVRRALAVDVPCALTPLSATDEALLRQLVLTGLLDRVARRLDATRARQVARVFPPTRASEWPFETLAGQVAYIHPHSLACPASTDGLPDWLCFASLSEQGWMEGVTAVEPEWIHGLASGSAGGLLAKPLVLDVPEPAYVPERDLVLCSIRPRLGQWELPVERVECSDRPWPSFAAALLGAKVLPGWPAQSALAAPPAQAARAVTQTRVVALVQALAKAKVASKKALLDMWSKNPTFLKPELEMWMTKEARAPFAEAFARDVARFVRT